MRPTDVLRAESVPDAAVAAPGQLGRGAQVAAHLGWAGYLAILWLQLLVLPFAVQMAGLDRSWYALLAHDWREGLQAGKDFVFTYGPLAWLLAPAQGYEPDLFTTKVAGSGLATLAVALAVVALLRRLPSIGNRLCGALLALYLAAVSPDSFYPLAMLAATALVSYRAKVSLAQILPVCAFLATLALIKFTYLVFAVACVALMALLGWRRRSWRTALTIVAGYVGAWLLAWVAAGQSLTGIPAYLKASSAIASGYNEVMGTPGSALQLGLGAASMMLLACLCAWVAVARPRAAAPVAVVLTCLAAMFVSWKGGFVRHDSGHARLYFCVAAFAPFVLLPAVADKLAGRRWLSAGAVVATLLALVGMENSRTDANSELLRTPGLLLAKLSDNVGHLQSLGQYASDQEQLRHTLAQVASLPETRRAVGEGTIDAFGHEQGVLFANDLRVSHRPVFQSYSAYTPALQELNAVCYEAANGPDHVLFKLQPIDDYYPTVADSQALVALLAGYRPVLTERNYLLLRRRPKLRTRAAVAGQTVLERGVQMGEWVDLAGLPGSLHLLSLEVHHRLQGRIRSFVLRPPMLFLEVTTDDGQVARFRIAPPIVKAPFLLNPLVRGTSEFMRLFGDSQLSRVVAFRVVPEQDRADCFKGLFQARVIASDELRPKASELTPAERECLDRGAYPMFHAYPFQVTAPNNPGPLTAYGQLVLFAHAPSELRFHLSPGRHRVSGGFGILEAAHQGDCKTDGVSFRVLRSSGEQQHEQFQRLLEPLTKEADRGIQRFEVDVECAHESVLLLTAGPGPHQNGHWDWSFWTDVRIDAQ